MHCVIVGFTRDRGVRQRLWEYSKAKGDPVEVLVAQGINAYLADGPHLLITKRSDKKKLSPQIPVVDSGSTAYDWGLYTFTPDNVEEVLSDPVARKYLRKYVGGEELINDVERWCLRLKDVEPGDIQKSPLLRDRIEKVKELRSQSKRSGTKKAALTPQCFRHECT